MLKGKQQRFVDEYLIDLNATQAAIRAGYSAKTARQIGEQNLTKFYIANAIKQAIDSRSTETGITAKKVLEDIELIKQHAMKKGYDAQGNEVMNNYPAALKACELQGKHVGAWIDKVEVTGAVQVDIAPKLSKEDWMKAHGLVATAGHTK